MKFSKYAEIFEGSYQSACFELYRYTSGEIWINWLEFGKKEWEEIIEKEFNEFYLKQQNEV